MRWPHFPPTDIEYYTEGYCWALAWQLHRQSGLLIYRIGPETSIFDCCTTDDWDHLVVRVGYKYLDIEGLLNQIG